MRNRSAFDGAKAMNRESDNDAGASGWSLAQLVSDPLIGLVMQSDGVDRHSIELLFERLARERRPSHGDAESRAPGATRWAR
jgi:hypothetical protein